jgi:LCP family protein required for cell wall assembly
METPELRADPLIEPAEDAPHRTATRRFLAAAALSWLVPGLGQLLLGRRRMALVFGLPTVGIVAWFAFQLSEGAAFFAVSLWDDSFFAVFLAVVVAFGGWRLLAVSHALAVGRGRQSWRKTQIAAAVVLVASIVLMHGAVAVASWDWYRASVQIDTNQMYADASPTPTPPPTASPTPTPKPTERPHYAFAGDNAPLPTNPYPASAPTAPPNKNRITFLLIGVDFMAGRTHSLTDTLMLVSVDTKTAKVSMISVPRDTSAFQLYWGPWVSYNFKINTLVGAVERGGIHSPDPGIKTLEKEIGFLVGIPVDYYAAVDISGFVKLVDGVGGVDVNNKHEIDDPPFLQLAEGPAHLDGNLAMRYVRSREHGGSDYLRSARQQEVMRNLEAKIVSPAMIPQLPALLQLAGDNISTDFPLNKAKNYVKLGQKVKSEGCVLGPPYNWHPPTDSTGGMWTSRLDLTAVAGLSVYYFGKESAYYGQPGVTPAPCRSVQ